MLLSVCDVKLKDREGYTALDLLCSAGISDLKRVPESVGRVYEKRRPSKSNHREKGVCDEVNLVHQSAPNSLFLPDSGASDLVYEDAVGGIGRIDPQKLKTEAAHSARVLFVALSKSSRVLLTAAEYGNIFVAGQGANGRLGTGSSTPSPGFIPVPDLCDQKVVAVDVCDDHTVCLTSENAVYTWGARRNESDQLRPTPVVAGDLRKPGRRPLVGVTCSKNHSVAYSASEMYIWGWNIGQMGFPSDTNGSSVDSTPPKKVEFKYGSIRQVCATDLATLVLNDKSEIHAYLHGFHARIVPPLLNKIDETNFNAFRPRELSRRRNIVRLVTQKSCPLVLMLYDNGDVWQFSLETQASNKADFVKSLRFSAVWKTSRPHLRCTDVSLASDASILVCVADGSVYKRPRRTSGKRHKFRRETGVNRVVRVGTDPLFSKFVYLREEVRMLAHRVPKSSVLRDFARMSPLYELKDRHMQGRLVVDESREPLLVREDSYCADFLEGGADAPTRLAYVDTQGVGEMVQSAELEYWLALKDLGANKHYDTKIVVDDRGHSVEFGLHREFVSARSLPLRRLFESGEPLQFKGISVSLSGSTISVSGVTVRCVAILLHFLYTDVFYDVWNRYPIGKVPPEMQRTRVGFESLSRLLGVVSPLGRVQCVHPLLDDLAALCEGSVGMEVALSDGVLRVPKFVLVSRSAFFETLLRWNDTITLPDISTSQFLLVLRYLSGCDYKSLFPQTFWTDPDEFCNTCLELLDVADMLLLPELEDLCQLCLKDFVNLDNYEVLLRCAYYKHASKLFQNCLWFVYNNLGWLLFDAKMDLEPEIMAELDKGIKWFDNLRKSVPATPLTFSLPQFLSDRDSFNGQFVHPLLWDVIGSFKQEDDLVGLSARVRRSSSKPSTSRIGSISMAVRRSVSSVDSESAITDEDTTGEFVVVGRRRNSSRRASEARRMSERMERRPSKTQFVPITTPTKLPTPPPPPAISPLPSLEDLLKSRDSPKHAYKYKLGSSNGRLSQKERRALKKESPEAESPKEGTSSNGPWISGSTWKAVKPTPMTVEPSILSGSQGSSSSGANVWGKKKGSGFVSAAKQAQKPRVAPKVTSFDAVLFEEKQLQQSSNDVPSFEDVHREEEFDKWWAEESARVQKGMQGETNGSSKTQKGGSKGRRRKSHNRRKPVSTIH